MANKVIRSSTVSSSWDVEYNVSKERSGASPSKGNLNPITELTITPKKGYTIDAADFTTGLLSGKVEYVRYTNTSNNINENNNKQML